MVNSAAPQGSGIPEHFLILEEFAKRSGTTPNSLRKHQLPGWSKNNQAMKDARGFWFVDQNLIGEFTVRGSRKMQAPNIGLSSIDTTSLFPAKGNLLAFKAKASVGSKIRCRILVDHGTDKFEFEGYVVSIDIDELPSSAGEVTK
jgi:hypothetical protein